MLQSVAFQPHSVSSRHPSSTFEPGNIYNRYSVTMHYPLQKILVVTHYQAYPTITDTAENCRDPSTRPGETMLNLPPKIRFQQKPPQDPASQTRERLNQDLAMRQCHRYETAFSAQRIGVSLHLEREDE